MKRKFISNLFLLLILNFLIKPFWIFGIEVGIQNAVGETMYGFYFSLFNFAFIGNILLDAGITNYNNRAIARDHELVNTNLALIIPLKFLLSIVYAIVIFISATIIGYSNLQIKLLLVLAINQFLSSFILYLRSNISGLQLFRTDSILSVLDRTLMIIMNGVLLWSGITEQPYKIEWFVYSQTVSYIITAGVVFSIIIYHTGTVRLEVDFKKFKHILRRSYPFAVLILLMSFFNRADSVMVERLLADGKEQAGIYAQSFRVQDALSQFALLFAGLLLPMFSRMLKNRESTDALVSLSSSVLMAVAIGAAVAGLFLSEEIITLLYGPTDPDSSIIFTILMFGFIFISLSYIHGTLLTANHSLKMLNILAAATVLINITLNLILIPRHNAVGAAIASLCSQGFFGVAQFIVSRKVFKPRLSVQLILRLILYFTIITISIWLLKSLFNWEIAFILFAIICIAAASGTGLIRPKELISIMRER